MNTRRPEKNKGLDALDKMIEEIIVDAYGNDEQLDDPVTKPNDLKDAGEWTARETV